LVDLAESHKKDASVNQSIIYWIGFYFIWFRSRWVSTWAKTKNRLCL